MELCKSNFKLTYKSQRYACFICSASSAYAVNIILVIGWNIKIDNMSHIWNIQSPGSHIRCYQYLTLIIPKRLQGPLTLGLIFISMN